MSENATLTAEQVCSLRCLAGMMIPASAAYDVPSAADDAIFSDVLRSFGRDAAQVRAVLLMADELGGGTFGGLDPARQEAVAAKLRETGGEPLKLLTRLILQCYYRDDRVMRSLNMEVRPPFPKGFEIEQGDWSLLDPVRRRGKIYRDANS